MLSRTMLLGLAIGAMVAFVADPQSGRRRRALARDQFIRAKRKTRDALDATGRDVANRTSGTMAALRGRWTSAAVDDERLVERVRAVLGRVCSHPRAIDVDAVDGRVTLRGPILAGEMDNVLRKIGGVRGVADVANELELHESADGIPALQGEGHVLGSSVDILQPRWAPATRAMVTAAGLAATSLWVARYARR